MRVSKLLETKAGNPIISFEFSRPKSDKAAANLDRALDVLKAAEPDYVSVTFGAGGSTREGSFQLVDKLKNEKGFQVVSYIAGVGLGPEDLTESLDRFKALGMETVFVVRGDAPTWDESYKPHPEAFSHASELLAFIKERYDFCLGAAAYPEGHLESESRERDLQYVKLKQDQGAEYIVAQYFYDNQYFFDFVERARAIGVTVPIIPGIMPIYTIKMMENLARLCGATITDAVREGLAKVDPEEKGAVGRFGVEYATEQCRGLLRHGVPGLHFYTMNRGKGVAAVVQTLRKEGLI